MEKKPGKKQRTEPEVEKKRSTKEIVTEIKEQRVSAKDWMGDSDEDSLNSFSDADELDASKLKEANDDSDLDSNLSLPEDELPSQDEQEGENPSMRESKRLILNAATEGIEEDQEDDIPDLSQLSARIQAAIAVLTDWKGHASQADAKPRSIYVQQLKRDLCLYFGYSDFLMDKLMDLFPKPAELHSFLEANEMQRPVTIRCNTLKCKRKELAQALIARGVNLEPSMEKWNPYGLQVFESRVPIGATPEYLAGHYMLQAAASFLPVLALGIVPSKGTPYVERILDMCAAPGGKTTFIGALMRNQGCLFANDGSAERCKALTANVHRMGVTNCVVTCLDGRKFGAYLANFDRILLDAPCSGTGVISKDSSVKTIKTADNVHALTIVQKELMLAAIDMLAVGGTLVYSTCSVLVEENEEIIEYALKKRPGIIEVVDTTLPFGEPGFVSMRGRRFQPSLALTRRYFPHTHNLDGFYVARLHKTKKSTLKKQP
jgi:ribosomal RNA methyltransferase Nop2